MKEIKIQTRIIEDKIATVIKTSGYDEGKISDILEIIGIIENLKQTHLHKLKIFEGE